MIQKRDQNTKRAVTSWQVTAPLRLPADSVESSLGEDCDSEDGSCLYRVIVTLILVAMTVCGTLLLQAYVVNLYEVPSGSMETTIMTHDSVLSERVSYYAGSPKTGDVVSFSDPDYPSRILIKRVIATEGQTIDLREGVVYVNNVERREDYVGGNITYPLEPKDGIAIAYPYTVPQGCVWVMGDNRLNSADSRYFGAIGQTTIRGHIICVIWPLNHVRTI